MPIPILKKRQLLGAKLESVEGIPETVQAGDVLRVSNIDFKPDIDMKKRALIGLSGSGDPSLPTFGGADISFDVEIKGSGVDPSTTATPPEWGKLLIACGFAETVNTGASVVYNPVTPCGSSITFGMVYDAEMFTLRGCRGNVVFEIESGKTAIAKFTFHAVDFTHSKPGMFSGDTYDASTPLQGLSAAFTLDSFAFKIKKLVMDIGNQLVIRDDLSAGNGFLSTFIAGRRAVGGLDPEFVQSFHATEDYYDFFGKWRSGATGALAATLGSTAGNIVAFTAPKVNWTNHSFGSRGEYLTLDSTFEMNGSAAAGNDELIITMT